MNGSLRARLFQSMLLVIVATAVIRIGLWLGYQYYEVRKGHIVLHEQVSEFLILLSVEVIALGLLGFLLWSMARHLLSPMRSIANAARLISLGKLDKRIRTEHLPEGELLDIANALNRSFDQYQESIDRISRFSSAASHQLRTPLTAIRTTAEMHLGSDISAPEAQEALHSILEETQRLVRLTEQLLVLSRMEVENVREDFACVDLSRIVHHVVALFEPLLETQSIQVQTDLATDSFVNGSEALLMEAVINLFDNATKASPENGTIEIRTAGSNGTVRLEIADSGPGIDAEYREQLFERFSRHSATTYHGSGLGLSIVSEIIRLHGGEITVGSSPAGGASFTVVLPHVSR